MMLSAAGDEDGEGEAAMNGRINSDREKRLSPVGKDGQIKSDHT